jgi:hypothetical protein
MGAVAVTVERKECYDSLWVVSGQLQMSSSYTATAGDTITPAQLGLSELRHLFIEPGETAGAVLAYLSLTPAKTGVRLFHANGTASEPAGTADLSAVVSRFTAYGLGG